MTGLRSTLDMSIAEHIQTRKDDEGKRWSGGADLVEAEVVVRASQCFKILESRMFLKSYHLEMLRYYMDRYHLCRFHGGTPQSYNYGQCLSHGHCLPNGIIVAEAIVEKAGVARNEPGPLAGKNPRGGRLGYSSNSKVTAGPRSSICDPPRPIAPGRGPSSRGVRKNCPRVPGYIRSSRGPGGDPSLALYLESIYP
jgi:hypothetical protein